MARFNLADYETVESRIKRFYEEYPDGRIKTKMVYDFAGEGPKRWVVKAFVYLTAGDQANNLAKATGYAEETDGTGGANNGSALENAETSAIGRALANGGWSGNKRASREEMQKVERMQTFELPQRDWLDEASKLTDIEALRSLWLEAKTAKASQDVLTKIKELADVRSDSSVNSGAARGVSSRNAKG